MNSWVNVVKWVNLFLCGKVVKDSIARIMLLCLKALADWTIMDKNVVCKKSWSFINTKIIYVDVPFIEMT